jgi:hypothetical protein
MSVQISNVHRDYNNVLLTVITSAFSLRGQSRHRMSITSLTSGWGSVQTADDLDR